RLSEPRRLFDNRAQLLNAVLRCARIAAGGHPATAGRDLDEVDAVFRELAYRLAQLSDVVSLEPEVPHVACGCRDRRAGNQQPRATNLAGLDRIPQRQQDIFPTTTVTHGGDTGLQSTASILNRVEKLPLWRRCDERLHLPGIVANREMYMGID